MPTDETPWWIDHPFQILFGVEEPMPTQISPEAVHSVIKRHGYGVMQQDDDAVSMWTDRNGNKLARVRFSGVNKNSEYLDRNVEIVRLAREGQAIVHSYKRRRRGEEETTVELVGYLDRRFSQLEKPDPVKIRARKAPANSGDSY